MTGHLVLSPAQRRYLARAPDLVRLHQAVYFELDGPVTAGVLSGALAQLVLDQEVFQARFSAAGAVRAAAVVPEVREVTSETLSADEMAAISAALHLSIDVQAGRLLAAAIAHDAAGARKVILAAHHLVIDIVSWGVVRESLNAYCREIILNSRPSPLRPPCSFWEWTDAVRALVANHHLAGDLEYWASVVAGCPDGGQAGLEGDARVVRAEVALTGGSSCHAIRQGGHLTPLIVGAMSHAIGDRIGFEMETHGRTFPGARLNTAGAVGWFTGRYPLLAHARGSGLADQVAAAQVALEAVSARTATYSALRYLSGPDAGLEWAPMISLNCRGRATAPAGPGRRRLLHGGWPCPGPSIAPTMRRAAPWEMDAVLTADTLTVTLSYIPGTVTAAPAAMVLKNALVAVAGPGGVTISQADSDRGAHDE